MIRAFTAIGVSGAAAAATEGVSARGAAGVVVGWRGWRGRTGWVGGIPWALVEGAAFCGAGDRGGLGEAVLRRLLPAQVAAVDHGSYAEGAERDIEGTAGVIVHFID